MLPSTFQHFFSQRGSAPQTLAVLQPDVRGVLATQWLHHSILCYQLNWSYVASSHRTKHRTTFSLHLIGQHVRYAVAIPLCTQTKDYEVAPPSTWLLTETYSTLYTSRLVCMACYVLAWLRSLHQTQSICMLYKLLKLKCATWWWPLGGPKYVVANLVTIIK